MYGLYDNIMDHFNTNNVIEQIITYSSLIFSLYIFLDILLVLVHQDGFFSILID